MKTDRLLSRDVPKVLEVVIKAALGGDMSAAKMILDRAVPARKADDGSEQAQMTGITISIKNLTAPVRETENIIEGEIVG